MAQDIIKHFPTIETVTEEMAKDFIAVTNKYIHDTGHCIVGITGGTAINALLEVLNNNDNIDSVDWEHIFFLWYLFFTKLSINFCLYIFIIR